MARLLRYFQSMASKPIFGATALIVTVVLMVILGCQGQELATSHAPSRIVSLELAWSQAAAEQIIESWAPEQLQTAINQVLVDFIFIAGYSCLLLHMGLASGRRAQARGLSALAPVAQAAGWGGFGAGMFDCLENFGLLAMLWSRPTELLALSTSVFATVKFALAINAIFVSANVYFASRISALQRSSAPTKS